MTGKANDGVSEFMITDTPSSVEERGDYLFIYMYLILSGICFSSAIAG